MELALAKSESSKKIEWKQRYFQIEHFNDVELPFRHHWKHLLNKLPVSNSSDVVKIIPYLFGLERGECENVDALTSEFLLERFPQSVNDRNFIVVQCGDNCNTIPSLRRFNVFQESVRANNLGVMPVHYNTEFNLSKSILDCENLAFFQGAILTNFLREKIKNVLSKQKRCIIHDNNRFFYHLNDDDKDRLKKSYRHGMENSKYILCPRGWGQNSIRFYEALSFGRIPVLIADSVQLVLPNLIPYEQLIIRVPEDDVDNILNYLDLPDYELTNRSDLAVEVYKKYFNKDRLLEFIQTSLKTKHDLTYSTGIKMDKSIEQRNKKHGALTITNACNLKCGGCHQLCGHWKDVWFIGEDEFIVGIECLIEHYKLRPTPPRCHINIYGGEPTIHPNWNRLLEILYSYPDYPFLIFTNGTTIKEYPHSGYEKFRTIFQQYPGRDKNVAYRLDKKEPNRHFAATWIAPCDILNQTNVDYWELAQVNCGIWLSCEMAIYRNKGYICTPAGAIDHMFYGGKYGWDIIPHKPPFERTTEELRQQGEQFCRRCRFCLTGGKLPNQLITNKTLSLSKIPNQLITSKTLASPTNYDIIQVKSNLQLFEDLRICKESTNSIKLM